MSVANGNNCESNVYRIKKMNFNGPCDIVTLPLADNGPCALVGLANVLLLRGSMSFPGTQTTISSSDLLDHIADLLMSAAPVGVALQDTRAPQTALQGTRAPQTALQDTRAPATALQDTRPQYLDSATTLIGAASLDFHARQLNSALTFLEHLPRGMEVDVKFSGVASFSQTPGLEVFSLLGVPLYHGWLLDPADIQMGVVVGDLSHAELIEKIVTDINSDDPFRIICANQAQEFLGAAPKQMTKYGLSQLTLSVEEGEVGVLYRNHQFVTICKHNGVIYQLVAHVGYLDRDDIVWQVLDSVDGVGAFVDHHFERENRITIVEDYKTREDMHLVESTEEKLVDTGNNVRIVSSGTGNNVELVDMDNVEESIAGMVNNVELMEMGHVEESVDERFLGGLDCKKPKVCPSGHPLKEVPVSIRREERCSGYGEWSCSSCKNNTLGLDGTRFRCDHHKVKNNTTPFVVSLRSEDEWKGWKGSIECDFDLCGECFWAKQTKMDQIDVTEENVEYRKHVTENVKELLLENLNGIYEPYFTGKYRDAFSEKIDFQKLGYPKHQSNRSKFLQSLSGSVLEMVYDSTRGTIGLYIKPSKSLLQEIHQSRIEQLSLLDIPEEPFPNQFLHNTVCSVRKQVQYPPGLKEGSSLDIIVSHVTSPAKFWFQLRGEETSDALESLMVDMESFYRNNEKNFRLDQGNPLDKCRPGAILAAPYQDNESFDFHRVHVNKIIKNNVNKVEVFYLDYGTIEKIPISCLRILHDKFCGLPAQALEGKLWGLDVPSGRKTWPKESARGFLKLVAPVNDAGFGCYSIVKRIQTDASNRVLHLQLIDALTTKSGLCINNQLVQEGLASSVQICEEEISVLPIRADPLFPLQCNASIKDINDKIKGIEEDNSKFDVNNNDNMEEATAVNNNSEAGSNTKILIHRVNISENLSVILLIDEGQIWLSSGDISALIPSWKGRDLLAKMLQVRRVSIDSVDIVQGQDKFEQIMNLGLKPTENLENVKAFQLYRIIDVPKLVTMFNKDVQNAKKIIEAVEVAADKIK